MSVWRPNYYNVKPFTHDNCFAHECYILRTKTLSAILGMCKKEKSVNGLLIWELRIKLLLKLLLRFGFCSQYNIIQESPLWKFFRHKSLICFKLFSSFLLFILQAVYNSLPQNKETIAIAVNYRHYKDIKIEGKVFRAIPNWFYIFFRSVIPNWF